jgi:hypothetical protein
MARKRRSLKVLGLAVVAVLALSAVMASAASAKQWYVNGSATPLAGSETVSCKTATGFTLTSKVGEITLVLKATGVECLAGSKIENSGGLGIDSGTLKFTGVTVEKPKNCSVSGGSITTNALNTELIVPAGDTTNGYDLFKPATGSEFVTVSITGGTCAVAGNYPVKGEIAGKGNTWGTELVEQPLAFSPTIDGVTGKKLTFGGEPATMEGTALNLLSGANVGKKFGGK